MPSFSENLQQLPAIDALERLELYGDDTTTPVAVIENRPGKAGSLAVYNAIGADAQIGPAQARRALELFAEHVADARANPGKHPNIDRLFAIIDNDIRYTVRAIPKADA